jgi:hypothetical protein
MDSDDRSRRTFLEVAGLGGLGLATVGAAAIGQESKKANAATTLDFDRAVHSAATAEVESLRGIDWKELLCKIWPDMKAVLLKWKEATKNVFLKLAIGILISAGDLICKG